MHKMEHKVGRSDKVMDMSQINNQNFDLEIDQNTSKLR